jgi:NAD(P)-dependent dehydrogenase (short-subunit alcohol dehydrogenase family)
MPVTLIFGGAGGVGAALCRQLAPHHTLHLAGRTQATLDAISAEVGGHVHVCDATRLDQVDQTFDAVIAASGQLDSVVCAVGSVLLKPAHRTSEQDWLDTLHTNLTSAFAVVRAAGRTMTRGGSVVLISSAAAQIGLSNHEAIAAAKAGVEGLARSAAATYAARRLRFNVVSPGLVRTPLTRAITEREASLKYSLAMHAIERVGEPEDIARMIALLVDPANDWITGQVFGVDGGLSTVKR